MEFRLFGPTAVVVGEEEIDAGPLRERAVLALLLLNAPREVTVDHLVDALWGESPPKTATDMVRIYVSRLRKRLRSFTNGPSLLRTGPTGYRIDVSEDEIDIRRFESLVARARTAATVGDDAEAGSVIGRALALLRGEPLADFAFDEFAAGTIRRLDEVRLEALELAYEARLSAGEAEALVGELTELAEANPYRERLWGQLMIALYRSGRQVEALDAFRQATGALAEVGLLPGARLLDLEDRILRHDPVLSRRPAVARLPEPVDSFIGRARELEDLDQLLAAFRLVTVTGPAGAGKSRLALEVARGRMWAEPDGVWLVGVEGLDTREALDLAVVSGLRGVSRGNVDAVSSLQPLAGLLLLDGCEGVIGAAAELATSILERCPRVRILATSREPLRVRGESIYPVPPLTLPQAGDGAEPSEATRLFLDRAVAVQLPGSVELELADRIVTHLEGLPLAIELAAGRVRHMGVEELARRIDDAIPLLVAGPRTSSTRHQTMEAAIRWSYDLLDPRERDAFRAFGVMRAPFDAAAAAAVLDVPEGETLELLSSLADKSMLARSDGPGPRFRLLEPLRQFAEHHPQRRPDWSRLENRRNAHYEAVIHRITEGVRRHTDPTWQERIELDRIHLAAAVDAQRSSGNRRTAARMAVDLSRVLVILGRHEESRSLLEGALSDVAGLDPELEVDLLTGLGWNLTFLGDLSGAGLHFHDALRLARANRLDRPRALVLNGMGSLAATRGDMRTAAELLSRAREAYRLFRAEERFIPQVNAAWVLGWGAADVGTAEWRDAIESAVTVASGISSMVPYAHLLSGLRERLNGAPELARSELAAAAAGLRSYRSAFHLALTEMERAFTEHALGNTEGARAHANEAIGIGARLGGAYPDIRARCLTLLAVCSLESGDVEGAAELLRRAIADSRSSGTVAAVPLISEVLAAQVQFADAGLAANLRAVAARMREVYGLQADRIVAAARRDEPSPAAAEETNGGVPSIEDASRLAEVALTLLKSR